MKTSEDIIPNLTDARYFSKIDARSGYWAIKLTEKSSHLTTFNTPFGRYRFLRIPFGIRSDQDEFQCKIDEIYEGLQGVTTLVDDILVYGKTREEHDANLRNVLTRSREKGVKLNFRQTRCWTYRSSIFRTHTVCRRSSAGSRQNRRYSRYGTSSRLQRA